MTVSRRRWLVALLATLLAIGLVWQLPKAQFSSDITALLPADRELGDVARRLTGAQAGKLQLLYSADSNIDSTLLAIDGVKAAEPATLTELQQYFAPHSARLLTAQQRQQLQQPDAALRAAIARYYSPSQLLLDIVNDPFGYQAQYLQQLPQGFSGLEPGEGGLQTRDTPPLRYGRYSVPQEAVPAVEGALAEAKSDGGSTIISSGAPLHIYRATNRALSEASIIGGGSMLAIVLLLLWLFGSLKPLLTTAIVIALGCGAGLLACLLVFAELQVIGLVFAVGVIGLAVDYVFHAALSGNHSSNGAVTKPLAKNLLLACLSSVLCYLCLLFQPIGLLNQVAVFAAVGLFTSLLAVLLLPIHHPARAATGGALNKLRQLQFLPGSGTVALAGLAALAFAAASFGYLHINNNLTALYAADADLQQNEQQFAQRSGQRASGATLLFTGASEQQVLERQEAFLADQPDAALCAAGFSPSIQRQQENLELLAALHTPARLGQFSIGLGLDASWIGRQLQRFAASRQPQAMSLPADLSLLAATASGSTATAKYIAPCLVFNGSQAAAEAYAANQGGVKYHDFVANSNAALNRLSKAAAIGLAAGCLLVAAWLLLRLGVGRWRHALAMLCLPVTACLGAVLLAGLLQSGLNIFHIVALFLVFGIGIDYAVFAFSQQSAHSHTPLAIACSGLTSILAFGLLGLSSNPAVASFGAVVAFGITIAAVLALVVKQRG